MALRRITQETFDAAVKENIEEFEMDPEDALRDALEQFESQGVDLTCIVKAVPTSSTDAVEEEKTHLVLKALESLRNNKDLNDVSKFSADMKSFTEQCQLGFAQRFLAAQKEAYPVIISVCKRSVDDSESALTAVSALSALTDGQPDLLDAEGQQFLVEVLKKYQTDPSVTRVCIGAVRHCCLKHEQNRQDLVKGGVLALLTGAITQNIESAAIVKEASAALRVMTFDDDVRVPYGQAHENAKTIVLVHHGLKILIKAAEAHVDNTSVLSELCATLSRLAVRNEFCQDICNLGGLKLMMTLMADCYESADLVRQVLSAIRAIAGNDDVKDAVVNAGGVQLVVITMDKHNLDSAVCEQGCACLSVLALRKPKNCAVIMAEGGVFAAIQAMKTHPNSANVQRQSCMLLRNLVARMSHFTQPILEMGAEALIAQALRSHKDLGDVGKAALRDLGCEVELRELWTGKHGSLTN